MALSDPILYGNIKIARSKVNTGRLFISSFAKEAVFLAVLIPDCSIDFVIFVKNGGVESEPPGDHLTGSQDDRERKTISVVVKPRSRKHHGLINTR